MRQIRLDPSKLERRGPTKIPKINKREGGGGRTIIWNWRVAQISF